MKKKTENTDVYPKWMMVWNFKDNPKTAVKKYVIGEHIIYNRTFYLAFSHFTPITMDELLIPMLKKKMDINDIECVLYGYAKNIPDTPEFVELTIQDISEGKGVGIDPELIRIKQ